MKKIINEKIIIYIFFIFDVFFLDSMVKNISFFFII